MLERNVENLEYRKYQGLDEEIYRCARLNGDASNSKFSISVSSPPDIRQSLFNRLLTEFEMMRVKGEEEEMSMLLRWSLCWTLYFCFGKVACFVLGCYELQLEYVAGVSGRFGYLVDRASLIQMRPRDWKLFGLRNFENRAGRGKIWEQQGSYNCSWEVLFVSSNRGENYLTVVEESQKNRRGIIEES